MNDALNQSNWIMPPIVGAASGGFACFNATTAEVDIDLTTVPGSPYAGGNANPIGHYVTLQADGADIYIAFAGSLAALGALSSTAVSTVGGAGAVSGATAHGVVKIPNGTEKQFKLPLNGAFGNDTGANSVARFLGFFTASATGVLRVYQSSQ